MADDDNTLRFQHYEVCRLPNGSPHLLGSGAMGTTYRAFDTNLRVPVALKVINAAYLQDEDARHRFLREARAAAQLRHPNVAAVYHLGRAGDDSYFYAMELVEGETFSALVRREGRLEPVFALELTLQVARALAAAHERGLIHRDIKPANLMLYYLHGEPVVKVIDFGLAKAIDVGESGLDEGVGPLTRTEIGGFRGTPNYASPEQLEELPVDTRSDIYSLGTTLWFMLVGQPPFTGTSLARIVTQQLSRKPPFEQVAHAPEPVRALLARTLEKNPDLRPQNPLALRDEILACLRQLSATPPPPTSAAAVSATPPTPAMTQGSSRALPPASNSDLASAATLLGPPPGGVLAPGTLLGGGRYRLDARLGADIFAGGDTTTQEAIVVRALPADLPPAERRRVAAVAGRLRDVDHPHLLLLHDFFIPESDTGATGYLVMDAAVGSDRTLRQLLTQRGALTLPETLAVLTPAAEGISALAARGVTSADLRAAHVFLPDDDAEENNAAEPPSVAERATGLLLGPTEFFPVQTLFYDDQTLVDDGEDFAGLAGSGPRALGWLAYELLGGSPNQVDTGRYAPLTTLSEAANAVLRRCCVGDDGATAAGFQDAREFVAALRAAGGDRVARDHAGAITATPDTTVFPRPRRRAWSVAQLALFLVLIDLAALGVWYGWKKYQPAPHIAAEVPAPRGETAAATSSSPAAVIAAPTVPAPFRADAPWTNSLGMKFVPVAADDDSAAAAGPLLASAWPARVQDFAAFVQATNYDATGGLYVLGSDGRRRQEAGRSWRDPGFSQGSTHPVVGVNFDDARAFCAWLTQREQTAGLLPRTHQYRLPTDAEWSRLAGLREAEHADVLPETRHERAADIFPWGNAWPPPASASPAPGNYAGAETTELPPDDRLPNYRDGFPHAAPVGSFPPNALGLYDCGGNVWQWCLDPFKAGADWRTVRGGSWLSSARAQLRLGARQGYAPGFRHDDIGFRPVLTAEP
ncbi:MAG: SUMF1/EgtB/PvdO family nonheme iron enzyme [Verrucomicrobia bacterium]|nr:SUMF1/EgtB/PvdO family nonheme iron enzyme [Verrucomicrobiota bacterium]